MILLANRAQGLCLNDILLEHVSSQTEATEGNVPR